MPIYAGNAKAKLYIGNVKVKKAYLGSTLVYSSGNVVTYQVDSGTAYQEEVEDGASCLSPKTFTPAKSGWTFVGWREDTAASASVLSSKVMGDNPVTLYAVFRLAVTVTYYNGSTTASSTSGYRYYNNGSVVNPTFTLTQAAKSGWTARGWSTSTAGNGAITYSNGVAFTKDSNITLYGMYHQSITLSYNGNGSTSGSTSSQTGTRYYNSNGNYVNPTFTLAANGFAKTDYTFSKWALGSTSGTQYAAGASITLTASTTMYAAWVKSPKTISVTDYYEIVARSTTLNLGGTYGTTIDCTDYKYAKLTINPGVSEQWNNTTGVVLGSIYFAIADKNHVALCCTVRTGNSAAATKGFTYDVKNTSIVIDISTLTGNQKMGAYGNNASYAGGISGGVGLTQIELYN